MNRTKPQYSAFHLRQGVVFLVIVCLCLPIIWKATDELITIMVSVRLGIPSTEESIRELLGSSFRQGKSQSDLHSDLDELTPFQKIQTVHQGERICEHIQLFIWLFPRPPERWSVCYGKQMKIEFTESPS